MTNIPTEWVPKEKICEIEGLPGEILSMFKIGGR